MSTYFDSSTNRFVHGELAKSSDLNDLKDEIGGGFDLLPDATILSNGAFTYAIDGGSANTYSVSLNITATSYVTGMNLYIKIANANSGASTLNVDSLGTKAIKNNIGNDISALSLAAGSIYNFVYDGTDFIINTLLDSSAFITLTGVETIENKTFKDWSDSVYDMTTETLIDPANGGIQLKTFTGDTTLTETLSTGQSATLILTDADSHTITWPTITWVTQYGDTAPSFTAYHVLTLWKIGSILYGSSVGSGV